jgi:hypothetical protein
LTIFWSSASSFIGWLDEKERSRTGPTLFLTGNHNPIVLQEIERSTIPSSHTHEVNPSATQSFYKQHFVKLAVCDIRNGHIPLKESKLKLQTIWA